MLPWLNTSTAPSELWRRLVNEATTISSGSDLQQVVVRRLTGLGNSPLEVLQLDPTSTCIFSGNWLYPVMGDQCRKRHSARSVAPVQPGVPVLTVSDSTRG